MSMATKFLFRAPFPINPPKYPVCIPEFDVDTINYSDMEPIYFFIRDLTLIDAMRLYWNAESIDLSVSLSGAVFDNSGTPETVDFSGSAEMISTPTNPNTRVCGLDLTATDVTANSYNVVKGGTTTYDTTIVHRWPLARVSDSTSLDLRISKQLDGLYTIWFLSLLRGPSSDTYASIGGGGTLIGVSGITYLNSIDIPVLSGTLRIYGTAYSNGSITYTSGGTLNSATLTPSYYTY